MFIYEHFMESIGLSVIAKHLHVNKSYLSTLYKKQTGKSVTEVLNDYRIEVSKKLLRNPDAKIYEVSNAVGFEDAKYFTHVFAKYTGMSPRQYKELNAR